MQLRSLSLDDLHIDDEPSFRHVALYDALKQVLRRDGYRFLAPPKSRTISWDRAVFLNLTFWGADEQGDVLMSDHIDADVITHVAWHHLCRRALAGSPPSADALFLGEAIASAFDLYLVGRLLGHAPDSTFLETQVPAMAEAAASAGVEEEAFEAMLDGIAKDPDRAFEDLRELLFDAACALLGRKSTSEAAAVLAPFDAHRFGPLLHHYELSNWILYARAYAPERAALDSPARGIDRALRDAPVALDWLERTWLGDAG